MPSKQFTSPPVIGVSVHFNYAFVTVNSEILLVPGTFSLYSFIYLHAFLTDSSLGTFCSNCWCALLDNWSFTGGDRLFCVHPFFWDRWFGAGDPHQGRIVNPPCFSRLTTFLFVKHFVCIGPTNVTFLLFVKIWILKDLNISPLQVFNTISTAWLDKDCQSYCSIPCRWTARTTWPGSLPPNPHDNLTDIRWQLHCPGVTQGGTSPDRFLRLT